MCRKQVTANCRIQMGNYGNFIKNPGCFFPNFEFRFNRYPTHQKTSYSKRIQLSRLFTPSTNLQ